MIKIEKLIVWTHNQKIKRTEYFNEKEYYIDVNGNIYSKGKLKKQRNCYGYKRVKLYNNSTKGIDFNVHQILGQIFLKDKMKEGLIIDHIDKNRSNNNLSNLRWVTQKENISNSNQREMCTGVNNWRHKTKEEYKNKPRRRCNFKTICKNNNWCFNDFEEVESKEIYITKTGKRLSKYFYIYKGGDLNVSN